ncbi:MAG: leucyl aminopeptidase family protein, partial [Planctomycetaceae bacterium]|nr:leucyl aminopeptidase family protein [Planctomycetaceae bacterium]
MDLQQISDFSASDSCDWLVLFVPPAGEKRQLPQSLSAIEPILERLEAAGDLPKKAGDTKTILGAAPPAPPRILLVGLGAENPQGLTDGEIFRICSIAARQTCDHPNRNATWILPQLADGAAGTSRFVELAATAIEIGVQTQAVYQQEPKKHPFQMVRLVTPSTAEDSTLEKGRIVGQAINLARDLINRCSEDITPEEYANRAQQIAQECGLVCEVFDEQRLLAERMTSLLAVARGSDLPPRVVKLEYVGAGEGKPWISLIGKGVTYDSGGLSIKPTDSMKTMKSDMSGAASVLAIISAAARLKLPVNLRAYAGLVENMISGRSYRVGDVITARNGKTIEVLNTDAEGRLVLADVLCYAVDEGCERMIDLATLTGSCVVALGEDYTGVFANDQAWCDQLLSAAAKTGEKVWQLPMCDSFNDQLKSDVADCKNVGSRWGGAITAAKFLE